MHRIDPLPTIKPAPAPAPCKNGPLCRVCRMGPGIAEQHDLEAKGLEARGHTYAALLHRQRAEYWRREVARCQAGVV